MFVYLDESGDTGFKFDRGSSRFFVVTLLLVEDPVPFRAAIDRLRQSLGFAAGNEFKWYASSDDTRMAFLRMARRQDFAARAMVGDETLITGASTRGSEPFYNFPVRMLLEHDADAIRNAPIVLDESVKSRKSKQELTTYLRKALNGDPAVRRIKDVRYHRSHADNLIQACDMLSGAIYARYHKGNGAYLDYVRVKIGGLWVRRPGDVSRAR